MEGRIFMEKTRDERRTRVWKSGTYRDKKAVIHHRTREDPSPFVPKIRVIGEVNVRELLGRDSEADEPDPSDTQ